ncbi:hypothetical protein O181_001183 [Austropuccinia psidii MF-1]|uniref:Uncharacterized protein n=1 Tax=Austropuccinia psidii MF-1 TaxID=1389203 RepID=A0A9Q3GBH2_9BASI|nr:hypothetical protein [Austropuccinia psidii MF-1]
MPFQHSPQDKNTRSQRKNAIFTPTESVPLDFTQSSHQLSANLDRGPPMEAQEPSRRGFMKSRRSRSFSGLLGTLAYLKGLEVYWGKLRMNNGRILWRLN